MFEKHLIEKYIAENGKDPVTGEEMTVDDIIDVKIDRTVRPRPPTFTSIPSLLSAFQNEWDALVLDSYNVRQQLSQTRQELATALYQHDAAIRVIARIMKERDEARDALSKVTIGAGQSSGDAMQVDAAGLPDELAAKVDATQQQLSKSRKKRPVPAGWATADTIETYKAASTSEALYPGSQSLAVNESGELAIVGGTDGVAGVYSLSESKVLYALKVGGAVTDAVFAADQAIVASSTGSVKVFNGGKESASFTSHAGTATSLALHPCGDILASVGVDKSFVFYDLASGNAVTQVYTDSCKSCRRSNLVIANNSQHSLPLPFIRMVTSLLQVAWTDRSNYIIQSLASLLRHLMQVRLCKIYPFQKTAFGSRSAQRDRLVPPFLIFERKARLLRSRALMQVAGLTAFGGTTLDNSLFWLDQRG